MNPAPIREMSYEQFRSVVDVHLMGAFNVVQPAFPMPMGVLYRHDKPTYESLAHAQLDEAIAKQGAGDLTKLMYSGMVWEVGADGVRH